MKATHIIPPAAALLVVAAWNLSRWKAVSVQEQETRHLRAQVETARIGDDPQGSPGSIGGSGKTPGKEAKANGPLGDWKRISDQLLAMQNSDGVADLRQALEIHEKISGMSRDEILAALDQLSTLPLKDEARSILEETLIGPLVELDPEYALRTFGDRIGNDDDGIGWQLSSALQSWASKDAKAAAAWMDQQIAAGLFDSKSLDGKSQTRVEFEAALAGALLADNPGEAGRRIAALPEEERREALEQMVFTELPPAGQAAYAALVRELVPQDERAGSFAHVIAQLMPEGGYEKVAGFLDQIQATPEERAVSAKEAANSRIGEIAADRVVTRSDVEEMRSWLERQAPGTVDAATGQALADAAQDGGPFGFEDASRLALEFHGSTGNDEVLVAFLESYAAQSNLEEALPMAEKIKDPQLREDVLGRLK